MATNEPFSWPTRVYYEDTDAGGVVYYANYLRFMERARTEWLRARGVEQDVLRAEHGIIFVVVSADVRFRKPAKFNDQLDLSVLITEVKNASLTFAQQVTRDGQLLCDGTMRAATVDQETLRPRRLPVEIRQRLI
ncbi:MAG: tol-pal system-associated acyl-CoA thioesterase [Gammaproteobacteria bacterium]|nr:tol-pal system-associated acyl-CoA thioesterase [Gammaproteobacteria bacterium]